MSKKVLKHEGTTFARSQEKLGGSWKSHVGVFYPRWTWAASLLAYGRGTWYFRYLNMLTGSSELAALPEIPWGFPR